MAAPLAGRRALVTGAARGIGAAVVRRLASDGAAVALTYNASAGAVEKLVAEVAEAGAPPWRSRPTAVTPSRWPGRSTRP
nr:SDR family NAD(P)-dependent oxidoreductase [Lentzea aerocolonigenes]